MAKVRKRNDPAALFRGSQLAGNPDGPRKGGLEKAPKYLLSMPRLNVAHTSGTKQDNNKKRQNGKRKECQKQETSVLVIGAWNVRTLMDRSGSDRPERRTALVGKELSRHGIDIAALSETRLAGGGKCLWLHLLLDW